jgi:phosphohistidine phosphatase
MKKLIFVRHGRAEELSAGISDFERSLTPRGKMISREMAERLREKENDPGIIITSPAFRALETAIIFAEEFRMKPDDIILNKGLYDRAGLKHLMHLLEKTPENIDIISFFGHNPAITEMPDRLCSGGCEFLTKTSIVCISFPTARWADVRPDTGKLEYFLKPE